MIALIDAGSNPERNWLELLVKDYKNDNDVIFGVVKPYYENLFQFCLSAIIISKSYRNNLITPSISCVLLDKKTSYYFIISLPIGNGD